MLTSNNLNSLDEGVEFGYRFNTEWIPLAWYSSRDNRDNSIKVGTLTNNNLVVRGFSVTVPNYRGNTQNIHIALKLCGSEVIEGGASLSFRWLQTVNSRLEEGVDNIAIDDVQIGINSPTLQLVLLTDNFDDQMSIK